MQIAYSLDEIAVPSPVVLTIGNFDGVHLGHKAVLKHLLNTARKHHAKSVVLTFSNHPSTVLRPSTPTPLLCSPEHKLQLLRQAGIDLVITLPFTKEFSQQTADIFLKKVRQSLPFHTLILGSDAHIGKNREGDQHTVSELAKTLGFIVEYFPDFTNEGKRISSSLIREQIQQGNLAETKAMLGHPFSVYGTVQKGNGRGAPMGFPTANIDVQGLCLPPFGVYAVKLINGELSFPGVANLGVAPTVRNENHPLLEVHLFNQHIDLYNKQVDVLFYQFIRPEKQFNSIEELRNQIAHDVVIAKNIHQ